MRKNVTIQRADLEDCMFGLGNWGVCLECGELADGCEPDARKYACDSCGESSVYGLEEALIMGVPVVD